MNYQCAVFTKIADFSKQGEAADVSNVRRVAVNIETTGLGLSHRVIEIGCVEMIGRNVTGRSFHRYINPKREIDPGALAVHGISIEFLADKPKFVEIANEFVEFIQGAELIMHNSEFDATYLNYELRRLKLPLLENVAGGIIDTLSMAKEIRPGLKNSIGALCAEYRLDTSDQHYHGALLDAKLLAQIFLAIIRCSLPFADLELLEQIEVRWAEVQKKGYQGSKWAQSLVGSQKKLLDASKTFRQWAPLNVYLSVARAATPRLAFSLRYQGQHVANLVVDDSQAHPRLDIDKKTAESNQRDFEIGLVGNYGWRDPEAVAFRKHFKNLGLEARGRSPEHRIEAIFLEQMADGTSKKFNGTLKNIQPILLSGCPFQMPIPISGNTGKPEAKKGNIDIVARRGTGSGTKISIWELKRPGVKAHAIEQAYIYGITLLKMLRSEESGHIWYNHIFGFNGRMPKKITVECVVAVSLPDQKFEELSSELRCFVAKNPLRVGWDTIEFYLANYTETNGSLSIDLKKG